VKIAFTIAVLLVLGGCAAPSEPEAASDEKSRASDVDLTPSQQGNSTRPVRLYSFTGEVVGTAAPHPASGPLLPGSQPAKRETFEVPQGVQNLTFHERAPQAVGSVRIEVFGPDGQPIFRGRTWVTVAYPGLPFSLTQIGQAWVAETFPPGEYEVLFYVAGVQILDFHVRGEA
jgi:hypothetical protein